MQKGTLLILCGLCILIVSVPVLSNGSDPGGEKPGGYEKKQHVIFTGRFTAVDAANSSVSLENKTGDKRTYTLSADTVVKVNGKVSTLNEVQVGMYGGVKMEKEGGPVLMLRAESGKK